MPKVSAKTARARRKPSAPAPGPFSRYALASVAGVVVILAFVGVVGWAGGYFGLLAERAEAFARDSAVEAGFEARRITVKGRKQARASDIQSALGPVVGDSILHFDPAAARRRIEALGWVKSAAVSRLLPDTIHVSIREREPAAVWQHAGAVRLIDENGAAIADIGADEYSGLPLVVGAGAPEAAADVLKALGRHPSLAARTSALIRVGERRWNLRLENGLDVKLPETGLADALAMLADLDDGAGTLDQPLEYIDLRDPERMTVRKSRG
jgi:cell division protein FtsQ